MDMPPMTRQNSGGGSRRGQRRRSSVVRSPRSSSNERQSNNLSRIRQDIAVLMSPSPWSSGGNGVNGVAIGRNEDNRSKYFLLGVGLVTTALQGGGLIFGFSAFADKVTKLPNSQFSMENVSAIFAIGHNITAWGCIASGLVLDRFGPRATAASGLLIEAIGHFIMLRIDDVPMWLVHIGYGMLGIGGCQVLLAALTFADAFKRAALTNSAITAAFQAGGFIFMILPYIEWTVFFEFYVIFCMVGAVVTGLLYPDAALPAYSEEEECSDIAELTNAMASGGTLLSILQRPGTIWFLVTFCVAGSAFTYGYGEFVVALRAKDDCRLNERGEEVCANKDVQDLYNNVLMPIVGNFILPCGLLLGRIIDKMGFAPAAFINIFFVQFFILCLWLLPLNDQYITLLVYNVANTAVFTVQNAYICAVGHSHIGALFGISNFVLGAGNLLADYLTLNPFGADDKVRTSLIVSCIAWLCLTAPCYYWVIVEVKRTLGTRQGIDRLIESTSNAASVAGSTGSGFQQAAATGTHELLDENNCEMGKPAVTPLLAQEHSGGQPAQEAQDLEMNSQGLVKYVAESVRNISSGQYQGFNVPTPSGVVCPRIECNLVVTVNPQVWESKVHHIVEAGHEKLFLVLDFDRTVTKCFLEDGSKSLDCHDILASIPKITRDCRQKMEEMMEKYYPIEIDPKMTREEKIPYMVEWYSLVNALLADQKLTQEDVAIAVAGCKKFRLRSGIEEVFAFASRREVPIIIISAGLGNVIEEVIRQTMRTPEGKTGDPWPNVRVLSNTLQWDEYGNHTGFSEPLIHMYNKSLQDAPADLKDLIAGRHCGILCGDGTGDLTMAHGHETSEVLKVGFLNEKAEERLPKYIGQNCYDRVILYDGTYEPVLDVLRRM